MKIIYFIFAVAISILIQPLAYAQEDTCPVVGIKETGEYLVKAQRKCFLKKKKAEKKGYVPFGTNTPTTIGYSFDLSGDEEVPPVITAATGNCNAVLKESEALLSVICVHNAAGVTDAHIHQAPIGEDGSVICDLSGGQSPINALCALNDEQIAAVKAGETYVNVHSGVNPGGEIRGQID